MRHANASGQEHQKGNIPNMFLTDVLLCMGRRNQEQQLKRTKCPKARILLAFKMLCKPLAMAYKWPLLCLRPMENYE
jgi:hypothetical protein